MWSSSNLVLFWSIWTLSLQRLWQKSSELPLSHGWHGRTQALTPYVFLKPRKGKCKKKKRDSPPDPIHSGQVNPMSRTHAFALIPTITVMTPAWRNPIVALTSSTKSWQILTFLSRANSASLMLQWRPTCCMFCNSFQGSIFPGGLMLSDTWKCPVCDQPMPWHLGMVSKVL